MFSAKSYANFAMFPAFTMLTAFQQCYRLVFIIDACNNRPVKSDLN